MNNQTVIDGAYSKLVIYLGERDRNGDGKLLADALLDRLERHQIKTAVLLRGVEGFGLKHPRQSSNLLTLSEDLPLVIHATDMGDRVGRALPEIRGLMTEGLIETGPVGTVAGRPPVGSATEGNPLKLTVILGRRLRINGRPGYATVIELLHRLGVAGGTVMLGVDGLLEGRRSRARFMSGNRNVPLLVTAVGGAGAILAAAGHLEALLPGSQMLLEPVRILKRDGQQLETLDPVPPDDSASWRALTVYSGEQSRHASRPLYVELVRRLRQAGAPGATALRGILGYHGDHRPHGDRLFSIRRRVPTVTRIVDSTDRIGEWYGIVDQLTDQTGLVTIESVAAVHPDTT